MNDLQKRIWNEAPDQVKIDILLKQTEWVIFKAIQLDTVVRQELIDIVVCCKQITPSSTEDDLECLLDFSSTIIAEFESDNGYKKIEEEPIGLNKKVVEYLCGYLAVNIYWSHKTNRTENNGLDSYTVDHRFLYLLGSLKEESPLARWLDEGIVVA